MTDLCKCEHALAEHQIEGLAPQCTSAGCICLRFRPSELPVQTRSCNTCRESKPVGEFYGRNTKCKDCDNARPRERSLSKIVRVRGRHRAVAELIKRHEPEFRQLLEVCTDQAAQEAEELAASAAVRSAVATPGPCATASVASPEPAAAASPAPLRLKPGQRRPGQTPTDRIDVGRCAECIGHHDRGHTCTNCGAAPHAAQEARDTG